MKLLIKPDNAHIQNFYTNFEHFHEGDSGVDLYCPTTIIIPPKSLYKISFQIKCEMLNKKEENVSYYLYPRSSIVKTSFPVAWQSAVTLTQPPFPSPDNCAFAFTFKFKTFSK